MDFVNMVAIAELAVVILAICLGAAIIIVFVRGWSRSKKGVFLLLTFASVAIVCVNIFTAVILHFQVSHTQLIPVFAIHPLYAAQAVFSFIGVVLSFIGNVLLVRLALADRSRETPNQAIQRTAGRPAL